MTRQITADSVLRPYEALTELAVRRKLYPDGWLAQSRPNLLIACFRLLAQGVSPNESELFLARAKALLKRGDWSELTEEEYEQLSYRIAESRVWVLRHLGPDETWLRVLDSALRNLNEFQTQRVTVGLRPQIEAIVGRPLSFSDGDFDWCATTEVAAALRETKGSRPVPMLPMPGGYRPDRCANDIFDLARWKNVAVHDGREVSDALDPDRGPSRTDLRPFEAFVEVVVRANFCVRIGCATCGARPALAALRVLGQGYRPVLWEEYYLRCSDLFNYPGSGVISGEELTELGLQVAGARIEVLSGLVGIEEWFGVLAFTMFHIQARIPPEWWPRLMHPISAALRPQLEAVTGRVAELPAGYLTWRELSSEIWIGEQHWTALDWLPSEYSLAMGRYEERFGHPVSPEWMKQSTCLSDQQAAAEINKWLELGEPNPQWEARSKVRLGTVTDLFYEDFWARSKEE